MDVVQLSQSRWWDNTLISRCQRWDISVSSDTTGAVTVAMIPSLCHLHTPGLGHWSDVWTRTRCNLCDLWRSNVMVWVWVCGWLRQFLLPSPVYCVVIFQGSRMGEWVIFSTECCRVFEERAVCAVPRPALSGPPPSTPLPPALSNRVTLGQVTPLPDSSKYFPPVN